ncbi:MAG: glutamate synthase-related protein [candidate division KSB1 bacterium]|nr:glutamate synthase-related protein [candidate division KSB1 bacterium]MDZ7393852.1 glutamate synthase-related protein [candidate division KSB1 bacterium]
MCSSRYHIPIRPVPPLPGGYPATFALLEGDAYVKYGHTVFAGRSQRGDEYWTAEIITQTWYQAETGRIPISGGGYGGKFAGEGFEGLWLDMSEIVRPTRDGIHGREYISTQVDIGARLDRLVFDTQGHLVSDLPTWLSIPIPILFDPLPLPLPGRSALRALAEAAQRLGTLALLAPSDYADDVSHCTSHLGALGTMNELAHLPWSPRYVEVEGTAETASLEDLRNLYPQAIVALRLPLDSRLVEDVVRYARSGVAVLHLIADEIGRDQAGRPLPEALQDVHCALVAAGLRDRVTLIVSGGIGAAEHVVKAIACGADAVAVDFALLIAWGCALWADKGKCPVESGEFEAEWGAQRIINLINAWRDQMLEALGAMGMREIRRLRGEIGRTIWYKREDTAFRETLGGSKPLSALPRLKVQAGNEGDFRWPQTLLLASQQQARTGQPPLGLDCDYRFGASDGGFDRLAFPFEFDMDPAHPPIADPAEFDLSLPLNLRADGRPELVLPLPWYGGGMSYGSIGLPIMLARARAAQALGTFTSTGEGGYPEELVPYADHIITQVATGLFGVREETIQRARLVEIKYAQGAKPGLGGHLLGNKNTDSVARLREAVQGTSLFSPFPFHSVYSVEDHRKHVDWLKQVNPRALVSVKVSTPTDVDMVAVGAYYAGAHIVHLDGAYGGTGAAPEIAKKNIAMPIEYAIPKVHRFLLGEGIRDEIVVMASGGLRSAWDVAKAIALGADGAVLGSAELVAIGCIRVGQCEKGQGCPFGITTTDPERANMVNSDEATQRIINLYTSWLWQLAGILKTLGMKSVRELRGRSDLLVYLE